MKMARFDRCVISNVVKCGKIDLNIYLFYLIRSTYRVYSPVYIEMLFSLRFIVFH